MKKVSYTVFLLLSLLACREHRNTEHSAQTGPLHVRHVLQTQTIGAWKIDIWLLATSPHVGEPIDIGIRLTPVKVDRPQSPKLAVALRISRKGVGESRSISINPVLQGCQTLAKGKELTYPDGETTDFPPKELCWQTVIEDSLKTDWRKDGKSLEPGEYALNFEVQLDNTKAKSNFKSVPLHIWQRKGSAKK